MRKILLLILLSLTPFLLFSTDAYFIDIESPFYDIVDDLYLLEGMAKPSQARPYSMAQARLILSRVDKENLDGYSATLFQIAKEYLKDVRWQMPGGFGFGAYLSIAPEMYVHSNGKDFRSEYDWAYGYDDRNRFLKLGLEFSVGEYFYTYADLMYTMGRYAADGAVTSGNSDYPDGIGAILPVIGNQFILVDENKHYYDLISSNIPPVSGEFEFEWPKRAFVSFGGKSWSFLFGRDRVNWGNSHVANFIIDDHVGYHDMARLIFFLDKFSYETTTLFFETRGLGREEVEKEVKMLLTHRLEFRPFKWLDFAISENVMYKAPVLSLQYLNPGFIFHNLNNRSMFNAIASAEVNVTPIRGLDLYAQFVLDQAVAPNESASQGNAWGFLAGAEYKFSPSDQGILSFNVEFDYTTPLLYRRDKVDFLMYQRSFTLDMNYPLKLYYIGYRYGGDVMLLHAGIKYDHHGIFSISLTGEGMLKGEMNMAKSHNTDGNNNEYPNYQGTTPSGEKIQQIIFVTLAGEYNIPRLPDWMEMSVESSLSFIGSQYLEKSSGMISGQKGDVQFSLALKLSI